MIWSEMTRNAYAIAKAAHAGQTDKGGVPYIQHPLAVAEAMNSEEETAAALLHDVIEDTELTADDLLQRGVPQRVVTAVVKLTRKEGTPYLHYVEALRDDPIAVAVKMADLKQNSDLSRLGHPPGERDLKRLEKYQRALNILQKER